MCGYSGHILHVVCFLLSWFVADFGLDTHYHKSWQSAGPPSHSNVLQDESVPRNRSNGDPGGGDGTGVSGG